MTTRDEQDDNLATMTFGEHLDELRRRVWISLVAVVLVMFVFLFLKDTVMGFVLGPYDAMWRENAESWRTEQLAMTEGEVAEMPAALREARERILSRWDDFVAGRRAAFKGFNIDALAKMLGLNLPRTLVTITPLQDIVTFMFAAFLCGIAVASPIVLHQMWAFIGAGLYKHERRTVMMFLPASLALFLGGLSFGYFVMVPTALYFLHGLASTEFLLTVRDYFRFLFVLTIALGCVFQLPVVMVALTKVGITTPTTYTRYWRHCLLTIVVLAAVFTPPDPVTQLLMAAPMTVLYGAGVGLSLLVQRKKDAATEAAP